MSVPELLTFSPGQKIKSVSGAEFIVNKDGIPVPVATAEPEPKESIISLHKGDKFAVNGVIVTLKTAVYAIVPVGHKRLVMTPDRTVVDDNSITGTDNADGGNFTIATPPQTK